MVRTNPCHNTAHWKEDEALREDIADCLRKDDHKQVRDAPAHVQSQDEDESQRCHENGEERVPHNQLAVLALNEVLVVNLRSEKHAKVAENR